MVVDFSLSAPSTLQASLIFLNQSTGRIVPLR
jgi:hypothetical protein